MTLTTHDLTANATLSRCTARIRMSNKKCEPCIKYIDAPMRAVHYDGMKLSAWMRENKVDDEALAVALGVATTTVNRMRRGVIRLPGRGTLQKLKSATRGKVTANDFMREEKP